MNILLGIVPMEEPLNMATSLADLGKKLREAGTSGHVCRNLAGHCRYENVPLFQCGSYWVECLLGHREAVVEVIQRSGFKVVSETEPPLPPHCRFSRLKTAA